MADNDIARTFITLPDTRLPTALKVDLSQRRGEETIIAGSPTPPAAATPRRSKEAGPASGRTNGAPPTVGRSVGDATTIIGAPSASTSPTASGHRIPLPSGFVVARYRIESQIGEGGFSLTYRATDTNLDRQIVVKELFLPEHCEREQGHAIRARPERVSEKAFQWAGYYFSQEAKITADMRHDNIVRLNDFFKTNGTAYIAYEMLNGADFSRYCADRHHAFTHDEGLDIFRYCADALLYVHERGFVHRDIKPSNVFIDEKSRRPILIDFGSALDARGSTPSDFIAVSDGFSAPELYSSDAPQGPRTDIYSLCATMYWALSGQRPMTAIDRVQDDPLPSLAKAIGTDFKYGERLSRVIETGMKPRAQDRYPDVQGMLDDLFPRVQLAASGYIGEPRGDKIFLSYRRGDSSHFSGRLLDFFEMRFGTGSTFFDVESIPSGMDFWDYIKSTLQRCAVLVVVIGPDWLEMLKRRQQRWFWLGRSADFVESEIKAAMEMHLPVLPVLFDGASMPKESDLPTGLKALPGLNAAIIGDGKMFRQGADALCDQVATIRTASKNRTR